MISRFENWICTNFGISEESHGGRNDPLGGLAQGMTLSGSTNGDISCFIFKTLEENGFGFSNADWITLEKMLKTVSTFVDDANLWGNSQGCDEIMSVTLYDYSTSY